MFLGCHMSCVLYLFVTVCDNWWSWANSTCEIFAQFTSKAGILGLDVTKHFLAVVIYQCKQVDYDV